MKNSKTSDGFFKRLAASREITKGKLLRSLLTGFAVPFFLFICAPFSVYFSNFEELEFRLEDFIPPLLFASVLGFVAIALALVLTKKRIHNIIFALCGGLVILAYIQTMITTLTFKGLPGDGNTASASALNIIVNLVFWLIMLGLTVWLCAFFSKAAMCKNAVCFLMCLVLVMQGVSMIPSVKPFWSKYMVAVKSNQTYLSTENILEVSEKNNIIVFVLDRFDNKYFQKLLDSHSPYIESLDGFTYYEDNISKYPRTFPGITSMLTGCETDFTSRNKYLNNSYSESSFLSDLKSNGYKINLFVPSFYAYDNAEYLKDIASNTQRAGKPRVENKGALLSKTIELSSYFWAPEALKSNKISTTSFKDLISYGDSAPIYEMTQTSDASLYARFKGEGLSTQKENGTFTFLHLRGCHSPYTIDANCSAATSTQPTLLSQTTGIFKFITEYMQVLKDKGLYDDATIIITGDHGALKTDGAPYDESILTALLVKEKGQSGTPLKTSSAQVSQDNLHATIINSAGIKTHRDYGTAYSQVPEGEDVVRTHYFQTYTGSARKDINYTYTIKGKGSDFSNWEITSTNDVGYLYQ